MKYFIVTLLIGIAAISVFSKFSVVDYPKTSRFGLSSHSVGKSCNKCHANIKICGTIYNAEKKSIVPNSVVKFSTKSDSTGKIKAILEVDKSGNFYTDSTFEIKGLFPLVESPDKTKRQYMKSAVSSGDCNNCHQKDQRIWID